jgi:hypothetical protein
LPCRKWEIFDPIALPGRKLASPYGPGAIEQLARLGGLVKGKPGSDNDHVQVAALNAIPDRAYGKPKQPAEEQMLTGISRNFSTSWWTWTGYFAFSYARAPTRRTRASGRSLPLRQDRSLTRQRGNAAALVLDPRVAISAELQ